MSALFLIRGLPGSGKSTLAKQLCADNPYMLHFEADMYFVRRNGQYHFDPMKLRRAHTWCQTQTENALKNGFDVVVSNTFVEHWELLPYQTMAKKFACECQVIVCRGEFTSIHHVPQSTIEKMKHRWQA